LVLVNYIVRELAEMLAVSADTVRNWEVRGIVPAPRNMERMKEIFPGLNISDADQRK
jgi:hypothetical protein